MRSRPRRLPLAAALLTLVLPGCLRLSPAPPPPPPPIDPTTVHLLVLNGGGRPSINYQSHLLHVRQILDIAAQAQIPPERVTVFSSDGDDPGDDLAVRHGERSDELWRLAGTALQRALRPVDYTNTVVAGVALRPATNDSLQEWFAGPGRQLEPGDTLLLYVTDHGEKNPADTADNTITLWGENEELSVSALRTLLGELDPQVRVVTLMSQCFSGSFYGITAARTTAAGLPDGSVCGYFASTRNRPAYGCYPENRGVENVGHSFRFFQGLSRSGSFAQAHEHVLVSDATPDVPLRSSDLLLRELLRAAAKNRDVKLNQLADELLAEAWRDRARWEPQIRLLDRIGVAFGFFSPRTLGELAEQQSQLPQISLHLRRVSAAWKDSLGDANAANISRFIEAQPAWKDRLTAKELRGAAPDVLDAVARDLLVDLAAFTTADGDSNARLETLHQRSEDAAAASYRMEVRLATVLRMRMILLEIAGRTLLEQSGTAEQRSAHAAMVACEDAVRLPAGIALADLAGHEPFPPFEADVARANAAMPAWMGIRFRGIEDAARAELDLGPGAARVLTVFPGSPAADAGLRVADIVVGPPGEPFAEFREVRSWTMLSEIGVPRPLVVVRDGEQLELSLVPGTYPLEWPSLPGPPQVGAAAPPLQVSAYRGDPAAVAGKPHLIFFWATWCAPCKAAVPALLEFEQHSGIPVVAVTDEAPETLAAFFAQVDEFPAIVALDNFRQTHQAYAVSGTPTFVLVDADGNVRHLSSGFAAANGLGLPALD